MIAFMTALATSAAAQSAANGASLTATCGVASVDLDVNFIINTEMPEHWAGWVIDRSSLGVCEPTARVVGPEAFPSGQASFSFVDGTAVPGQAYRYRMVPVDAQGATLHWDHPDYDYFFPPAYLMIDRTTCDNALAVRGRLIDSGWTTRIERCEGQCWEWLDSIDLPDELMPLIGTDVVVELWGTLLDDFEGAYLVDVTSWAVRPDCGVVATETTTWSEIKARFR
jgi:hypothetical protein